MTTADVLRAARALIEDPAKWTQRAFTFCGAYCASGALMQVQGGGLSGPPYDALKSAMGTDRNVCAWNDSHTHAEVLAAFDRAIALAGE